MRFWRRPGRIQITVHATVILLAIQGFREWGCQPQRNTKILMKNCVRSCCVVGCLQHSNAQGAFTPRCSCNEQADVPQLLPGPKPTLSPFLGLEPFLRNAGPPMHN
jgi:hypothetical protein